MQYNEELGWDSKNANYHVHNKLFIVISDDSFELASVFSVSGFINTWDNWYRSVYLCFIDRAQVKLFFSLFVNNIFMELVTASKVQNQNIFFSLVFISSLSE